MRISFLYVEAKGLARQRHQTVDEVVATVFRGGLKKFVPLEKASSGILLSVRDTTPVTLEFVNELRDEYGG